MSLVEYRRKRNFGKTAEPAGGKSKKAPAADKRKLSYVIQKHDATRLHYDFRLELDGVLKSWAVPKGPSVNPADKVLAVQVEDHPIEYGSFEGIIPEGQYGGGTVMLWDRGTWEPIGDPREGLRTGKLTFMLHGARLQGEWALVRMRGRPTDKRPNWLLIKHKDQFAAASSSKDPRAVHTTSITSKRSLEQIASSTKARVWKSTPAENSRGSPKRTKKRAARQSISKPLHIAAFDNAPKAAIPRKLSPELATLVDSAPRGNDWIHEVKFDGYRILIFLDKGKVRLISRRGNDWTHRFPSIAEAAIKLPTTSAIIDGEAVALNAAGHSDFQALQNAMRAPSRTSIAYYAFDLPHLGGHDLTALTLLERKAALKQLLDVAGVNDRTVIRYSEHIAGDGGQVAQSACRMHLEGIMCKLGSSPYRQRRTTDWVKLKCSSRQEFVIGGFTEPKGSRSGLGALFIGYHDHGRLHYAGKVGTGFSVATLRDIRKKLGALETAKSPFVDAPAALTRGAHWVKPELVGEVRFTGWTNDGSLRHPAFEGLRFDKPAAEVVREVPNHNLPGEGRMSRNKPHPKPTASRKPVSSPRTSRKEPASASVAGIRISHPDRVVYPDSGITKQQVAQYYEAVAEWLGPHLLDRPVSIVRCPTGIEGPRFYQKNLTQGMPPGLASVHVKLRNTEGRFIVCTNLTDVIGLVQMGALEFHPWGSTAANLEHPDRLTFDLDPGPGVTWPKVVAAAKQTRQLLKRLGLTSFVKTTGGKGLHVVVPLVPSESWEHAKSFAHAVASQLADDHPAAYTTNMNKAQRPGRIFVDYLRNGRGATAVAAYSTRARAGATISMPVAWSELESIKPEDFTIQTVPDALAGRRGDPWKGFFKLRQRLPAASKSPHRSTKLVA